MKIPVDMRLAHRYLALINSDLRETFIMYDTSEDAIEANERISLGRAKGELAKHYCKVLEVSEDGSRIRVTNECDPPEWIECTTRAVMIWLGY